MLISLAVSMEGAIEFNDELIVYSRMGEEYVGVGGAGKLLLEALVRLQGAVPSEVLFANVLGGVDPSASERALLEEALRTLVDVGLCNERS